MSSSRILKLPNRGQIKFLSDNAFSASIKAAAGMAGDYSWTLPAADAVGYISSDGAGNLQFLGGTSNNQSLDQTYHIGQFINADIGPVRILGVGTGGLQVSASTQFGAGPWYDITHPTYGAVAGQDCTAAIIAADTAAPAGAALYFPDNVLPYKIDSGAWLVTKQRTLLAFGGATLQALPGTTTGQSMISVGDDTHPVSNFRCYNLNIDGNFSQAGVLQNGDLGANASSHGIKLWNVTGAWIEGCFIYGIPGDCISCDYGDETNLNQNIWISSNRLGSCYRCSVAIVGGRRVTIVNNIAQNYSTFGIDIEPNNLGESANRVIIEGNIIEPSATRLNPYNSNRAVGIACHGPGVDVEARRNIVIQNNYIGGLVDSFDGLTYPVKAIYVQMNPGSNINGNQIFRTRLGIDCISGNTDPGSSGTISGNHVRECTDTGIGAMYGMAITGNVVELCGNAGIHLYHTNNACIGNICRSNGTSLSVDAWNRSGFWVEGNGNILIGNHSFNDATNPATQQYGLYLANGVTGNTCSNNDFTGNSINGIRPPPAIGTNKIRENQGFITEKSASVATIVSGTTEILVLHGLDWTPRSEDFVITPLNKSTANPGRFWLPQADISATFFKIKCETDPGASGASFSWAIRTRLN